MTSHSTNVPYFFIYVEHFSFFDLGKPRLGFEGDGQTVSALSVRPRWYAGGVSHVDRRLCVSER